MVQRIVRWDNDVVIWEGEAETIKDAINAAVKAWADLSWANLSGADLSGANLSGANLSRAKDLRLPTGETWLEYLTEVVPALLTVGGKSLESFTDAWKCHSWDNCPMAHAFDTHELGGVPLLLRPRADQFIQFFDAKQIPWPLPTKESIEAERGK